MAIQESDIMDFGNGIIGDDTFDVWRKKTNSLKGEIDIVNTTLTNKINTDVAAVIPLFVPIAGNATSVSTSLQLTSPLTLTNILNINGVTLTGSTSELESDKAFHSSIQLSSPKVKAESKLILGTKEYDVPSSPAINNAVLTSATTAGQLQWRNAAELFASAGGLQQTTAVFEEVMPVGAVIACAEDPNDNNFLECNGGAVAKNGIYNKLYQVLKGTASTARYGETATTFNLPDYRGRVLVGTGTAGSVNFGNTFGVYGGDNTTFTNTHTLTAAQSGLPAHHHVQGHNSTSGVLGRFGNTSDLPNGNISDVQGAVGVQDTGANTSTTGGTADDDAAQPHSHNITTENRIQPYLTVKYYIKAIENSKVDFKIDVNNSGLTSTDGGGTPQTLLSVSNETHTLSVNPDNTSISVVNSEVAIKTNPTIPGNITTTGPDFKLNNSTRAGGNSHSGRALVHGNGNGEGDPELNGYDRKTVTTIRDSGVGADNDTLIINYNNISPNSSGDYSGGVIINGTKAIMFEDGTALNTANPIRGEVKKMMARQKGYSGITARGTLCFIDHDDQPRAHGFTSEYKNYGPQSDHSYGWNHDYLPDEEEAQDIYLGYYHVSCVTKTGKIFGKGWSNIFGDVENVEADGEHAEWCRAFTNDNSVKFYDSAVTTIDTGVVNSAAHDARSCYALDTNGLLWGASDANNVGQLARGGLTDTNDETAVNVQVLLSQKRDELAGSIYGYTETDGNRLTVPHVMNPLTDNQGEITVTPSNAVGFHTTFTQAVATGGNLYCGIAALGADGKVYTAGNNVAGQCGVGNTTNQTHWGVVRYAAGPVTVELSDVVEIYSKGYVATVYARTSNGDIWGWGQNTSYQLGNGTTTSGLLATKIWDASERGASGTIYSSGSGRVSGNLGAEVFIVTDHAQPQLWGAGTSNHYGFGQDGDAQDVVYTTWKRVTSGPWNTSTHTVQNFYNAGGQASHGDPNYTIALNNSTNKLEMWVTGYGGTGGTGITYSGQGTTTYTDAGGYSGGTVKWERIRYLNDRFLRKVIDVYPMHMNNTAWNSNWSAHVIHLNDGRIFGVGHWPYGGLNDAYSSDYFWKWQEMNTRS